MRSDQSPERSQNSATLALAAKTHLLDSRAEEGPQGGHHAGLLASAGGPEKHEVGNFAMGGLQRDREVAQHSHRGKHLTPSLWAEEGSAGDLHSTRKLRGDAGKFQTPRLLTKDDSLEDRSLW